MPPEKTIQNTSSCNIMDVYDGHIYKEFKALDSNKNSFTFILNTDGIELSLKSTISIWPVYLAINELPISSRYDISNIIFAGA